MLSRIEAPAGKGRPEGRNRPAETTAARTAAAPTTADQPIIEVDRVIKTYGSGALQVSALRGVSLRILPGEMVAVMGPSGCGKTTLLNCASGLDVFDAGAVRIGGTDISTLSDRAKTTFRARSMGFIFQTYNLLPVLSAVENVELPLVVSGVNAGQARRRAQAALERVGLPDKAGARPSQLSGGQRQRVTVARALVNDPAIVWADEPTGALDSRTADDVMALMEGLNRDHGLTFVIVTHDPRVGARCHRTIHMNDGSIAKETGR